MTLGKAKHFKISCVKCLLLFGRNNPVNEPNDQRYNYYQESLFEESIEDIDQ